MSVRGGRWRVDVGWGLAAPMTLSVRLFVCLLTSTSIQRLIGHSLPGGGGEGGAPGGIRGLQGGTANHRQIIHPPLTQLVA